MKLPQLGNTFKANMGRFNYLILLPILALAFYIAFIPHHNYPFPVHIDEWAHMATQNAILKAGSITHPEPFFGQEIWGFTTTFESGYDVFWGVFREISGIPWETIYRFFPGIIFMIIVLNVYILTNRQGFGWEAALFTCLIPTTVGILGPAFLVPVAMGLLFIPLSLFVAFNCRGISSYIALFIFTTTLLVLHAVTAVGLVIILAPYVIINLKNDFKHCLGIMIALGAPCLIPFLWISSALFKLIAPLLGTQYLKDYVDYPQVIQTYGSIPLVICLLGTFVLAIRGGKKNYSLVLSLLVLLLMLTVFFTFHYGILTMYERGLMWTFLMLSIVSGAGLTGVKNFKLPTRFKAPAYTKNIGYVLCAILVGLTLYTVIPKRQNISYYQMIGQEEYEAFTWIRNNIPEEYNLAILDPWLGTPFVAITEKYVHSRIHAYPKAKDEETRLFLEGGCIDTTYLEKNGVSIVYTKTECLNPDLEEVHSNVYLLK